MRTKGAIPVYFSNLFKAFDQIEGSHKSDLFLFENTCFTLCVCDKKVFYSLKMRFVTVLIKQLQGSVQIPVIILCMCAPISKLPSNTRAMLKIMEMPEK